MNKVLSFFSVLALLPFLGSAQDAWTLQRCIDEAFQKNITLQQSALQVELAEINQVTNKGALLPSLNAQGGHGYNWGQTIDPFTNTFATERIRSNNLGIGTGLTLFDGFQNINRVRQGSIDIEVQKANLERAQNDLALNVANAFLNVLFQEEFLKVAEANLRATETQTERIKQLVDAGAVPLGNLYDIEAQLATDQAAVVRSENSVNLAYLGLRQLLLIDDQQADDFVISAPGTEIVNDIRLPDSPRSAVSTALNTFPEVKSALAGVESANLGLKIARGSMAPRLNVSYSYGTGYSGARRVPVGDLIPAGTQPIGFVEGTGDLVVAPNFEYTGGFETKAFNEQLRENVNQSLFFNLSIPLFNGFATRSNVKRAEVGIVSAQNSLELVKQQLRQTVETAFADALASLNSYRAAESSVKSAQLAFEFAEVRYQSGASNIVDYTTARTRFDAARADLIRNKYDYIFRAKVLEFYMGQPLTLR